MEERVPLESDGYFVTLVLLPSSRSNLGPCYPHTTSAVGDMLACHGSSQEAHPVYLPLHLGAGVPAIHQQSRQPAPCGAARP